MTLDRSTHDATSRTELATHARRLAAPLCSDAAVRRSARPLRPAPSVSPPKTP
jgi:hypothetical protein